MDASKRPAETALDKHQGAKKAKTASSANHFSPQPRPRTNSGSSINSKSERNARWLDYPPSPHDKESSKRGFIRAPEKGTNGARIGNPRTDPLNRPKVNTTANGPDPRREKRVLQSPHSPESTKLEDKTPAESILLRYTELVSQRQILEYDIRDLKEKVKSKTKEYKSFESFGENLSFLKIKQEKRAELDVAQKSLDEATSNLTSVKEDLATLAKRLGAIISTNASASAPDRTFSPSTAASTNWKHSKGPANGTKDTNESPQKRIGELEHDLQTMKDRLSQFPKSTPEKRTSLNVEQLLEVQELIRGELRAQLTEGINSVLPELLPKHFEPGFQKQCSTLSERIEKALTERLLILVNERLNPMASKIDRNESELNDKIKGLTEYFNKWLKTDFDKWVKEVASEIIALQKRIDAVEALPRRVGATEQRIHDVTEWTKQVQEWTKAADITLKNTSQMTDDVQKRAEKVETALAMVNRFLTNKAPALPAKQDQASIGVEQAIEQRPHVMPLQPGQGQAPRAHAVGQSTPSPVVANGVIQNASASVQRSPLAPKQLDPRYTTLETAITVQRHSIEEIRQRLNNISTESLFRAIFAQISTQYPVLDMNTVRNQLQMINNYIATQKQEILADVNKRLNDLWSTHLQPFINSCNVLHLQVNGPQPGQQGAPGLRARIEGLEKMIAERTNSRPIEPTVSIQPSEDAMRTQVNVQECPAQEPTNGIKQPIERTKESFEPELKLYQSELKGLKSDLTDFKGHVNSEIEKLQDQAQKVTGEIKGHTEFHGVVETAISNLKVQLGFDPNIANQDSFHDEQGSMVTLKDDFDISLSATAQDLGLLQKQVAMISARTTSGELERQNSQPRNTKPTSPTLHSRIKDSERPWLSPRNRDEGRPFFKPPNGAEELAKASASPSLQSRISDPGPPRRSTSNAGARRDVPPPLRTPGKVVTKPPYDRDTRRPERSPASATAKSTMFRSDGAVEQRAAVQRTSIKPNNESPAPQRTAERNASVKSNNESPASRAMDTDSDDSLASI